ncbi:YgaP family membrane protein [Rhizobium sp. CAU 1783]
MFTKNVGSVDRILRIVVGLIVLSLFFIYPGAPWRYFALIGIVPLLTGLFSTCPLYSILGISTCPMKKV